MKKRIEEKCSFQKWTKECPEKEPKKFSIYKVNIKTESALGKRLNSISLYILTHIWVIFFAYKQMH